jgi:site-specific DNA-methyltransferase (adenine-specific)
MTIPNPHRLGASVPLSLPREGDRALLRTGDAVTRLGELADDSVDCAVTSPPYWGLRDYLAPRTTGRAREAGPRGAQLGREPSVEGYLAGLAAVFAQLARVVRPSGTVWLNLGDTYGGSWGNYVAPRSAARTATARRATTQGPSRPPQTRCRPKDLQAVPWRAALMLAEQGWRLRAGIVWHKPNARPESVRDRLAQRHEMVFLLSRTGRHWWHSSDPDTTGGLLAPGDALAGLQQVWSISTPRARTGHPAPGPVELVRRCLRHGCPPRGVVLDPFCGSGTTGVAALEMGHRFIGIDLDPTAIAIVKRRLFRAAR